VAALAHLQHNILNLAEPVREVLLHILCIQLQLLVDGGDGARILCEQASALPNRALRLCEQALHHTEWAEQLQTDALLFVQRAKEVVFERPKTTALPQLDSPVTDGGASLLRLQC